MDRYNFEEHITAYIDNELSEHEKKEFEDIINSDTDCRIKFKEVKSLVKNLHELPRFKTSDNFISDLNSKIQLKDELQSGFINKVKSNLSGIIPSPTLGFAMSVGVLFIVSFMFINSSDKSITLNITDETEFQDNIYISDSDTTGENNEYDGDILQTKGTK